MIAQLKGSVAVEVPAHDGWPGWNWNWNRDMVDPVRGRDRESGDRVDSLLLSRLAAAMASGTKGDRDRFVVACRRHGHFVARLMGRHHHGADDTAQEVAVRVVERVREAGAIRSETAGAWVWRITLNAVRDVMRRRRLENEPAARRIGPIPAHEDPLAVLCRRESSESGRSSGVIAVAELCIATLLLRMRWRRMGVLFCTLAAYGFLAFAVWRLLAAPEMSCGCFGGWLSVGPYAHLALLGLLLVSLGVLARESALQ
jgi:DNA-directed RNA polymerase specialized sigma24 family protein